MKQKIFSIIAVTAIIIMNSCKENGTGPTQKPFKNPREMTWTADTLQVPEGAIQLIPRNLLVFSPDDAWLCCWSDVINGLMWHYDGTKWIHSSSLEELGGFRVADIAGTSSKNLWTAGYSGENVFMAYYKGVKWERYYPNIKGDILDMSTDANGNIWACGRNGLVMKYENNKWIADTIIVDYVKTNPEAQYLLNSIEYHNGRAFSLATIFDYQRQKDIYYYVSGDIKNWIQTDSMIIDSPTTDVKLGNNKFYSSSYGRIYSVGQLGIWMMNNNAWVKIYNSNSSIYGIYGASEQYVYAVGDYQLLFYDGGRWSSLADIFNSSSGDSVLFTNVWTNGYETIISGYGTVNNKQSTIIWHGK